MAISLGIYPIFRQTHMSPKFQNWTVEKVKFPQSWQLQQPLARSCRATPGLRGLTSDPGIPEDPVGSCKKLGRKVGNPLEKMNQMWEKMEIFGLNVWVPKKIS
jgi:hypothetical protein